MTKVTKKTKKQGTYLSPFLRGAIFAFFLAGHTQQEIADEVEKPDGTNPTQPAVAQTIAEAQKNGGLLWDGGVAAKAATLAGRPRSTQDALDKKIYKLVLKHRGRALVTVKFIKKKLLQARKVSDRTLSRRLVEAGLAWFRRRRKSLVPEAHKVARLDWAAWVLARTVSTLARWAYTDGTVFYIARCQSELESKARAALGPYVWRMANGADALYEDCVGPSSYAKAQGKAIRVWGLLVAGVLFITVLPVGEVMNRWTYAKIIKNKFPGWLRQVKIKSAFLVQDHERALWTDVAREAMEEIGINLLENYPKCSQDLNPIETAWREVRARLDVTMPSAMESRDAFITRLRTAVAWINNNRGDYLMHICSAQKAWARDVIEAKPPGSRTKH